MSEPLFVRLRNVAFSQSDGMIKCDTNCKWKSMTDKVDIASNRSTDISTTDYGFSEEAGVTGCTTVDLLVCCPAGHHTAVAKPYCTTDRTRRTAEVNK